jgi:hypothetical protein
VAEHDLMAVLADAALDERERQVLERLLRALVEADGDDLDAVWGYGSPARGERPHDGTPVRGGSSVSSS